MANEPIQSYANHTHRPTLTAIAGLPALLAFVLVVLLLLRDLSLLNVLLLCLTITAIALVLISRSYTVRLQDRIIRLEMLGRLERLGRGAALSQLSMKQLTALRFASDAELPALLDRALAENLSPDQIKRAVKAWQPDWLRT